VSVTISGRISNTEQIHNLLALCAICILCCMHRPLHCGRQRVSCLTSLCLTPLHIARQADSSFEARTRQYLSRARLAASCPETLHIMNSINSPSPRDNHYSLRSRTNNVQFTLRALQDINYGLLVLRIVEIWNMLRAFGPHIRWGKSIKLNLFKEVSADGCYIIMY